MKPVLIALICLLASSHFIGAEAPADERATWEARIKKVQVGMSRKKKKKILPKYVAPAATADPGLLVMPYSSGVTTITGSRQIIRYYVSPGWCVFICYDYTGVTPENSKGMPRYQRPENKVLAPVILDYHVEPAAKTVPVKSN
ncbi:MAG: hypothetical protein ACAH88_12465 [Roseimicrobium sp.]